MSDAVARLRAAGVPNPAGDAARLARHFNGPALDAAIARRVAREPVSHILGRRAFWNHEFEVGPDVLDPRPDTETLIEAALTVSFDRVLDLGTGSGCILLSLLAERERAVGVGTDISGAALAVAARNAARLDLAERAELIRSDWLAEVQGRFDLIVSNPPYIAEDEMADLQPEVREWEPQIALTPGGDGLDAYRIIARDAPEHLVPGGRLIVEIGTGQGAAVETLFGEAGLVEITRSRDLNGHDRVVSAEKTRRPGRIRL
ncbi:Release factor glutamine methyltransferase [Jannaschia seosinensis]|uniref:Release factor glutamine methyltransferase n=1 Tax=Jannaschia seosinensis TaxID=313367 RepID=A0A0M7BCT6_9RHOB|nr:peptide chain release factor N(5)-glutamine methyltransferase [Jannaschia seosinensis]CUH39634.1 Release factor glutamine methyltransferase [Jannaschia seosinensis]